MSTQDNEKLLKRVRSLFAMSKETEASPHEAEIALRRCNSLMQKFGITEADLHTSEFSTKEISDMERVPTHMKILGTAVELLHDTLFVVGGRGNASQFRGFDIDAQVSLLTLDYLRDAVERCLKAAKKRGLVTGRSAGFDYRMGFSNEVLARCKEIADARKVEASHAGTSLVVMKMQMVKNNCMGGLRTRRSTSRAPRDGTAHNAGIKDGKNVSLNSQVTGGSARPALGCTSE